MNVNYTNNINNDGNNHDNKRTQCQSVFVASVQTYSVAVEASVCIYTSCTALSTI